MIKIGDIGITPLSDGEFRLDGGAMFGVVPRAIWEKLIPPDEKNRIRLAINPLLIRTGGANILVETGLGDKHDQKFSDIYAPVRPPTLIESLKAEGLTPGDISVVINTHLHFDHAGGNTLKTQEGLRPAFPRARYIVQASELAEACSPSERSRASYREEDFGPVQDAGLFDLLDDDSEVASGVSVVRTPGHNAGIQLVKISSGGETAVFVSDVIPTTAHLKGPYIPGYDLFPLETLEAKKELLSRASRDRWLLVFFHDTSARAGYVHVEGGKPVFEKVL